jgi:hypothetical protein
MSETTSTKTCNKCKHNLPLTCFSKYKSRKGGLAYKCKTCDIKDSNKWNTDNSEKKLSYDKKYYYKFKSKYDKMILDIHHSIEPAVYMIKNVINGKKYIGSSKAPYRRIHQHLSYHEDLDGNYPSNRELASDVHKYGKEAFVWGIIEYTTKENKFSKEHEYISIYQPEYNIYK